MEESFVRLVVRERLARAEAQAMAARAMREELARAARGPGPGLRRRLAQALIRLGVWLAGPAPEGAGEPGRPA